MTAPAKSVALTQASTISADAENVLNDIIKTFSLYEMRLHWKLPPDQIHAFKNRHAEALTQYSRFKFEELKPYLTAIDTALKQIKSAYPHFIHCKPTTTASWQPAMSMRHAKEWAVNSKYKRLLYHLTAAKAKPSLLRNGFLEEYVHSGATAFFTPSRSILNNILHSRPANNTVQDSDVVFAMINIPHDMVPLERLKPLIPESLNTLGQHFPLFWGIKNEYRMKARKIIYNAIFKQLGIQALSVGYRGREEGEIMITNPRCITLIKEPHQLDYKLNYPDNPNMICASLTLKDYIPPDDKSPLT